MTAPEHDPHARPIPRWIVATFALLAFLGVGSFLFGIAGAMSDRAREQADRDQAEEQAVSGCMGELRSDVDLATGVVLRLILSATKAQALGDPATADDLVRGDAGPALSGLDDAYEAYRVGNELRRTDTDAFLEACGRSR